MSLCWQPGIMMLKDRLFHAQGEAAVGQKPQNSSNRVGAAAAKPAPAAAHTPAPKAQIMVNHFVFQFDYKFQDTKDFNFDIRRLQGQYQRPNPAQVPAQPQPPMPSVFTPNAAPTNTGPGLPPSSHVPPPCAARPAMGPSYPPHRPPAPGWTISIYFSMDVLFNWWCLGVGWFIFFILHWNPWPLVDCTWTTDIYRLGVKQSYFLFVYPKKSLAITNVDPSFPVLVTWR